ncbi:hypothetical protein ACJX0J_007421, partial [Zea mays]
VSKKHKGKKVFYIFAHNSLPKLEYLNQHEGTIDNLQKESYFEVSSIFFPLSEAT